MNKKGLLVLALVLFLYIAPANLMPSSLPATIPAEQTIKEDFAISTDGDESSESITSFSETLDDDLMLYPDSEWMNYIVYSDAQAGTTDSGSLASTKANDGTDWSIANNGATASVDFFFLGTGLIGGLTLDTLTIDVSVVASSVYTIYGYNYTLADWQQLDTHSGGSGDYTFAIDLSTSTSSYLYLNSSGIYNVHIRLTQTAVTTPASTRDLDLDYADLSVTQDMVPDYAESFADVSDWSTVVGNGISSDGDICSQEIPNDNNYDYVVFNDISLATQGYYLEVRHKENTTTGSVIVVLKSEDDYAGTTILNFGLSESTSWNTEKIYISSDLTTESIGLIHRSTANLLVQFDYLRISPSTETGWQHDGSTTEGISSGSGGSFSSDGDVINCSSSVNGREFKIKTDITATQSSISTSYYPFISIRISALHDGDGDSLVWRPRVTDGSNYVYLADKQGGTGTFRYNLAATGLTQISDVYLYIDDDLDWFQIDYIKFYSIANFTVTQGANTINDVIYEDSGSLKFVRTTATYFILNLDPALSVATATYSSWNLTLSNIGANIGASYDWRPRFYIGSTWQDSSDDNDQTRGDFDYSGTITDFIFVNYESFTFSAITFIEDSTAPTVVRSSVSPRDPHTASTVTLSAVATDTVLVYEVDFTVIVAPSISGSFSASEIADNLWTYTFASTLAEGYYCFKVEASDGANINALTSDAYVDFTISKERVTSYIRIFDSLGDWVPFETFEVYRNSSRQYTDIFSSYTDEAWQIQVQDRFGETLNTTTFSAGTEELVVIVNIHSLKIQSWHHDYVYFNLTRSGITYREVIAPLEIVNFRLYENTYTWLVDYRNGTTINGETTLSASTCIVITGSTIADVAGISATLLEMSTNISVTVTATNNQVLTISIDLDNVNATINNQLIQVLLNITNTNTTIYQQTVDLLAAIQNSNSTLYNQVASFIIGVYANQSSIYSQTVTLLANIANLDSDIVTQTVTLLAELTNINSNITAQTVTLLASISNVNTTLYTQTVSILTAIYNFNSTIYNQTVSILTYIYNTNSEIYSQLLNVLSETDDIDDALALIDDAAYDLGLDVDTIKTNVSALANSQVYNLIVVTGVIVLASIFSYGWIEAKKEYKRYQRAVRAGGS